MSHPLFTTPHVSFDVVNMPERRLFPKAEHYYSVLFHELTHSTGHASRLDRATLKDSLAFGDTNYSKEELCAEMGAAYLCGVAGIANETVTNSAAYIQGWLGRLRNDKRLLVQAAAHAQKAADFILGEREEGSTEKGQRRRRERCGLERAQPPKPWHSPPNLSGGGEVMNTPQATTPQGSTQPAQKGPSHHAAYLRNP